MARTEDEQRIRWSESLAGIAQTGLAFAENGYERERYEQILEIAGDIASGEQTSDTVSNWLSMVGVGVPGYATAKSAVGAFVPNDDGKLLLIQRSDSHRWFVPTGWSDVGYSLSEVVAKEVLEETGYIVRPMRLAGVIDGMRAGSPVPHHTAFFVCTLTGGSMSPHPLECDDAGWFSRDALPSPLVGNGAWVDIAFGSLDGNAPAYFDEPRDPVWRKN